MGFVDETGRHQIIRFVLSRKPTCWGWDRGHQHWYAGNDILAKMLRIEGKHNMVVITRLEVGRS